VTSPLATSAAPSAPLLLLANITKRFGGTLALESIDWSVAPGEVHCLVGENGSGKSTLIKILSGVHAPDVGGEIKMGGVAHPNLSPHQARQLGIQVIFQDLSLFPNLTVEENIAIGLELSAPFKPPPRKEMRDAAKAALARLDAQLPLDAPVGRLSVAQRQIVAICRGLAANARILFMDEPTASLTRREVDLLLATVRRLKEQGVSIVFVSHRLDEVVEIAERVTVLRDGRKVGTFPAAAIDDNRLSELMTGESIEHTLSARPTSGRRRVLEVNGASRAGEFEDVSFTIHEGEILGLIGLLGAGRTELALTLFGMSRLDSGEISVDGRRLRSSSNRAAMAAGIAYASEDRLSLGINLRQSIADNTAITVLTGLRNRIGLIPFDRRASLARSWIERLNIRATAGVEVAAQTLSGGNQQRVVLAKWLATRPKVLILDGPTIGVDIRNKAGIHRLVRSLADSGMAILLISDEVPEVYLNCDRVLHMRTGRIAGEFVPGAASEAQLSEALYA
jgi:simple sugar transport system ATP-binding protein